MLEDVNVVRTHTPLHLAARNGHMNVVSYFLSCGMDVNITVSMFARDRKMYVSIVKPPINVRHSRRLLKRGHTSWDGNFAFLEYGTEAPHQMNALAFS